MISSRKTICISILLILLAIPIAFYIAGWIYFAAITETLVSWNTPHTREVAIATEFGSNLGLPTSAKDIYASSRTEGSQQNTIYLRFTATPDDIETFITSEFNRSYNKGQMQRMAISKKCFDDLPSASDRPTWWKPQIISSGAYIKKSDIEFGPQIWIDATTNTIYYYNFF